MSSPTRILLTTFGSFGDIHPYMAIGLELNRRGYCSVVATSEAYRAKIESAGLEFASMRPNMPEGPDAESLLKRVMDSRHGSKVVIREIMLGSLRETHADIFGAASGCSLIISHALTYASPIVAEQLGIPWVFTGLQPVIFFSADDPSVPPSAPWTINLRLFGSGFYRALINLGIRGIDEWAEPILELRSELDLPPLKLNPIVYGQYSPSLNLALFSKHFAPMQPDWPANTAQPGFPFYDAYDSTQQGLTPEVERFLNDGDPPIVFTLGTAAVRDARDFYTHSIAAARRLGKRAILLTGVGTGNELGLDLGPDILAVGYAPYAELFPRALINVHQGGIGTTAQALRSGKPMLVMPYAHDQPDNAARITRLGVGRTIARSNYTPETAYRELASMVSGNNFAERAREIGKRVSEERGVSAAVDEIERVLVLYLSKLEPS